MLTNNLLQKTTVFLYKNAKLLPIQFEFSNIHTTQPFRPSFKYIFCNFCLHAWNRPSAKERGLSMSRLGIGICILGNVERYKLNDIALSVETLPIASFSQHMYTQSSLVWINSWERNVSKPGIRFDGQHYDINSLWAWIGSGFNLIEFWNILEFSFNFWSESFWVLFILSLG